MIALGVSFVDGGVEIALKHATVSQRKQAKFRENLLTNSLLTSNPGKEMFSLDNTISA